MKTIYPVAVSIDASICFKVKSVSSNCFKDLELELSLEFSICFRSNEDIPVQAEDLYLSVKIKRT